MKYSIRENMSKGGFYVVREEDRLHLVATSNKFQGMGEYFYTDTWKNHKTAREAIGHLRQILGKKLRMLEKKPKIHQYSPIRYVYSD